MNQLQRFTFTGIMLWHHRTPIAYPSIRLRACITLIREEYYTNYKFKGAKKKMISILLSTGSETPQQSIKLRLSV